MFAVCIKMLKFYVVHYNLILFIWKIVIRSSKSSCLIISDDVDLHASYRSSRYDYMCGFKTLECDS